jgi:hypothetical protein
MASNFEFRAGQTASKILILAELFPWQARTEASLPGPPSPKQHSKPI